MLAEQAIRYKFWRTEILRRLYVLSLRQPVDFVAKFCRWIWLHSWSGMLDDPIYDELAQNSFSETIEQARAHS